MRTPEEIKAWFRNPAELSLIGAAKKSATLGYIEQLEKKVAVAQACINELETNINLMKIQMMGDCGVCKYKNNPAVCPYCMSKKDRPCWEYEGLPDLPKKGASK